MKRILTSALAAVVVAAGTGSEAQAQDMMTRRASLFDLGLYAGGAYSSPWFSIDNGNDSDSYAPGFSPIFGLTATYWATPSFGIRAHGAFMPSNLPEGEDTFGPDGNDSWVVNNYFYDLNLAFRPWILNETAGNFMANTYFFLGGGGLTSNVAGESPTNCVMAPVYMAAGTCVPTDPSLGSVGQGVVGVGFDVFPVTSSVGIFGELAVHGYDSPVHVYNEDRAQDKIAFTPRASLGLKFAFGDQYPQPVVVAPLPIPTPEPTPTPVDDIRTINVCVVEGGMLREVQAQYNATRGDTMVNNQPFSTAYPATTGYAAGATWYINSDVITVNSQRYVKFGLPRVLGVNDVTRMTDYMGVPVFAETGATTTPDIIYIPVRPGCEFQPYQREQKTLQVRG